MSMSERYGQAITTISGNLERATRRGNPKDAKRLAEKVAGLEYCAGVMADGQEPPVIADEIAVMRKRLKLALKKGHKNTAMGLDGRITGLTQGLGIATTYSPE